MFQEGTEHWFEFNIGSAEDLNKILGIFFPIGMRKAELRLMLGIWEVQASFVGMLFSAFIICRVNTCFHCLDYKSIVNKLFKC